MWYVVQVRTGSEESILTQCNKNIPDTVLERCFIPYYEQKKRIQGEWKVQRKILFPGYIFVITEQLDALFEELRNIIGFTRLIGTGKSIVALEDREVEFLESFGGEEQIVQMSEGIIENTKVIIHSGPLQGKEGLIKKIDRHKRIAYLELPMFGRVQTVQVGLEIVAKTV